ncbi:unnamed protein product, partial [Choristocarpus tenellus]
LRGLSHQQLGVYAEAKQDFDRAIEAGPLQWQRLWHRGVCQLELDCHDKAVQDFNACAAMAEQECLPAVRVHIS